MLKVLYKKSFIKDVKKLKKRNYELSLLQKVINLIALGEALPREYKEHYLTGKWKRI